MKFVFEEKQFSIRERLSSNWELPICIWGKVILNQRKALF